MASPLEQFKIIPLYNLSVSWYLAFSNAALYSLFALAVFLFFFVLPIVRSRLVPNAWQLLVEDLYTFLVGIGRQQLSNPNAFRFFPLISSVFLFVLLCNCVGLTPLAFTVTSHIYATFLLAFSMFLGITILGFYYNRLTFIRFFIPSGVPAALVPFLVLIEIISYVIRPFSLSIRLFANMLAGHTLLFILSGFAVNLAGVAWLGLSFAPIVFVFLVVLLEIGIAFIQAYVFCVLLFIYLNDIYKLIASH